MEEKYSSLILMTATLIACYERNNLEVDYSDVEYELYETIKIVNELIEIETRTEFKNILVLTIKNNILGPIQKPCKIFESICQLNTLAMIAIDYIQILKNECLWFDDYY